MMAAARSFGAVALSAEDWELVFQKTLAFADYQVRRLRWRHQCGGVLPCGFDPNSIAAQAISITERGAASIEPASLIICSDLLGF